MRRTLTEDEEKEEKEEKRRQYWVEEWKGSYRKKTVGTSHERLSRFVGGADGWQSGRVGGKCYPDGCGRK